MKNRYLQGVDIALLRAILFFALLTLLLLPYYQHQINSDGVSYISIAQKYMRCDFGNAANGYWGPLYSWLLIPFLLAGIKPLLAAKLLSLAIGAITIWQLHGLVTILKIDGLLKSMILWTCPIIIAYYALTVISPDLLFLCIALAYLRIILNSSYRNTRFAGIGAGALGAALYLAKSIGFPFFVAHFSIVSFLFYCGAKNKTEKKAILRHFSTGMVAFTMISLCWISIISAKYDHVTIGTSGGYNHGIMGPGMTDAPLHDLGLFAPPNSSAISAWEDVSYVKIKSWGMFDSFDALKHQVMITLKNIHVILTMLDESSFFALAFLAMAAAYLSEQRKRILRDPFFYLLIALVILFSGYSMVLIEERYLWLGMIIILVAGSMLLQWLFKKMAFFKLSRIIVVTIFAASFVRMPLIELYRGIGTGNDLLALNDKIKDLHLNGRVASDEHWSESLFLAFYNDWRYYGERGGLDKAGLRRELQDKKIDYYIDWKPFENDSTLLGSYPEITKGSISELEIYKLAP